MKRGGGGQYASRANSKVGPKNRKSKEVVSEHGGKEKRRALSFATKGGEEKGPGISGRA